MPGSEVFGQFISGLELVDKSLLFELNLSKLCLRNSGIGEGKTSGNIIILYVLINTFTAIVDLSRFNNSSLKSPTSTLVDLTFQSRALRSFSLNQLRNLSL